MADNKGPRDPWPARLRWLAVLITAVLASVGQMTDKSPTCITVVNGEVYKACFGEELEE